mgnify:CR=1 FL=1
MSSFQLTVEGGIKVLYKGVWVNKIPFDSNEITIGVMDPENNIYPDINLRQYRLDGGDPYISRKHARFYFSDDKYFVEDICQNNSTSIDTKSEIINGVSRELFPGARIYISESVVFLFEAATETLDQDVEKEPEEENASEPKEPKEEIEGVKEAQEAKEEDSQVEPAAGYYYLEVEGQVPLFFKPRNIFTHIIELIPKEWETNDSSEKNLQIGRRSTEDSIYPDIDLWKFYFNNPDEYIARRHAQIVEQDGELYFQDISGKGSTWHDEKNDEHRLLRTETDEAKVKIEEGKKLIISDSVTLIVHKQ